MELLDRIGDVGTRWIHHGGQTEESQLTLDGFGRITAAARSGGQHPKSHGQYPQRVARIIVIGRHDLGAQRIVQLDYFAVE